MAVEILKGKLKGFKLYCELSIAAFFQHSSCIHRVSSVWELTWAWNMAVAISLKSLGINYWFPVIFSPCSADALYYILKRNSIVLYLGIKWKGFKGVLCGLYSAPPQDHIFWFVSGEMCFFVSDITASSESGIWVPSWALFGSGRMYCSEAQLDLD